MLDDALTHGGGPGRHPLSRRVRPARSRADEVGSGLSARRLVTGATTCCILAVGAWWRRPWRRPACWPPRVWARRVWDVRAVKPLDPAMLTDAAGHGLVVTVEDGIAAGRRRRPRSPTPCATDAVPVLVLGVPDRYLAQGTRRRHPGCARSRRPGHRRRRPGSPADGGGTRPRCGLRSGAMGVEQLGCRLRTRGVPDSSEGPAVVAPPPTAGARHARASRSSHRLDRSGRRGGQAGADRVVGRHDHDHRAQPMPPDPKHGEFLVGRARELDELRTERRRSERGQLRVALVLGGPGLGKTRLAAELRRRGGETAVHLVARTSSLRPLPPFRPLDRGPAAMAGRRRQRDQVPAPSRPSVPTSAPAERVVRLLGLVGARHAGDHDPRRRPLGRRVHLGGAPAPVAGPSPTAASSSWRRPGRGSCRRPGGRRRGPDGPRTAGRVLHRIEIHPLARGRARPSWRPRSTLGTRRRHRAWSTG